MYLQDFVLVKPISPSFFFSFFSFFYTFFHFKGQQNKFENNVSETDTWMILSIG